uniref:Protein SDA1 n=1 Tax=Enterobius vermicularis TaxID=51028 RepID=A0A0N4V820_ENTVE
LISGLTGLQNIGVVFKELLQIHDKNSSLQIHKDADSYRDEFKEQFQHYLQTVKLLNLQPTLHRTDLVPFLELINFLSMVASHYPDEAKEFSSSMLLVLRSHSTGLNPEIRLAFCKALVILRNRRLVDPLELLELFFELVKCDDKQLRRFVYGSTVSFLKRLRSGKYGQKVVSNVQASLFVKLKDSRSIVARVAELVLIDAFRKNILRDAKSANAISECCFHKLSRLQVAALRFFLGSTKDEEGLEDDSESEEDNEKKEDQKTLKEVVLSYRAAKKTRKKIKMFEKAKKLISKEKNSKKEGRSKDCNLYAIQSLYDPQTFCDRLFALLTCNKNERFDLRLLRIALCARVIGIHKLQTLSFYSYLHRYFQPKQREVTRLLLYAAQACHELVPPDIVEQLVRVIAQNFVTDRNSPEAITVGLNTIREIFTNCSFAATEDLLRDLTEYKKYKNKNVSMAARGLITLFRTVNPKLLYRKDRGRLVLFSETETTTESLAKKAEVVSESRILTQEEFRKIHAFQLRKQVVSGKQLLKKQKRKLDDITLDEELEEKMARLDEGDGLPRLKDIEHFHKKIRRQTKEERMKQAAEGRPDKDVYSKPKKAGPHVGRTNRQLAKRKNFQMVRQKIRGRNRQRSFRDQQKTLRNYLLRQSGRKV